jgi:hypothetical protein
MSEDQQDAIIGRTLKEYQTARKTLAALHSQAEYLGNYLGAAGAAIGTNHSLWVEHYGTFSGAVDLEHWPTREQINALIQDIVAAQREKNRLAALLKDAGFEQPA